MLKKLFGLLLAMLLLFHFVGVSTAQSEAKPNFTVNHVESGLGKIGEKINLFFRFDSKSKVDYYLYLLEKRLAEVAYVVESDQGNSVEETASRYTTYIGVLTDYTISKGVNEKKDELINAFGRHGKVLLNLQSKFPANSGWWLAMQHTINSTADFSEKLKAL